MIPALGGAFAAGLLGSPHCVGMCGGFVVASTTEGGSPIAWHTGRLITYAILGALAGLLGGMLPGPSWVVTAIALALLLWFSARLAGLAPETHLALPGLGRIGARLLDKRGVGPRVLFGMLTGLMPCGLVYAALSLPVALGDPLGGALAMVVFGLGTVPLLSVAAVGLRRLSGTTPWVRRGVAAAVLASGLWSMGLREIGLIRADAAEGEPPACHDPG